MSDTPDPPEASPTTTAAAAPPRTKPHLGRRAVVWGLIVLASVLGVVSILASWANQQMLDNDSWRTTSQEIIQNPKVAPALSAFAVDQLYSNVDLAGDLGAQLPPALKPLAGPAVVRAAGPRDGPGAQAAGPAQRSRSASSTRASWRTRSSSTSSRTRRVTASRPAMAS